MNMGFAGGALRATVEAPIIGVLGGFLELKLPLALCA